MTPLSSYGFPCHSPFQAMLLPFRQSVTTVVPNMYCLMASGSTSARHTFVAGAFTVTEASASRFLFIRDSLVSCRFTGLVFGANVQRRQLAAVPHADRWPRPAQCVRLSANSPTDEEHREEDQQRPDQAPVRRCPEAPQQGHTEARANGDSQCHPEDQRDLARNERGSAEGVDGDPGGIHEEGGGSGRGDDLAWGQAILKQGGGPDAALVADQAPKEAGQGPAGDLPSRAAGDGDRALPHLADAGGQEQERKDEGEAEAAQGTLQQGAGQAPGGGREPELPKGGAVNGAAQLVEAQGGGPHMGEGDEGHGLERREA